MYDVYYYIVHNYVFDLFTLIQLNQTSKEFHHLTKKQIKLYKFLHIQSLTFFDDLRFSNAKNIRCEVFQVFDKVGELILAKTCNNQPDCFWDLATKLNEIVNSLFPLQEGDIFGFNYHNCLKYCKLFKRISILFI